MTKCHHLFIFIMGCAIGKESPISNVKSDLLPQLEAGHVKKDTVSDNFTVIKPDAIPDNATKYRAKIDSRVTAKYDIKALIGKGSFGDVLRVESKTSHQPYAVKIVKVRTLQEQEVINSECDALKLLDHPFIIKLQEVIISKDCTYLIMELATGGELYDRIKSRGHLDEKYSCNITQMLLSGLTYLHAEGIVHRDLKPENLLFYHPGMDSKIIITDFGFAKKLKEDNVLHTWCGTPEYISPELIEKKPYNMKVDLWALGVIVFVMLSGHLPFSADTTPKLFKQIMEGSFSFTREIWRNVSDSAKDFIESLLQVQPEVRYDAVQASSHVWMSSYPWMHKPKLKHSTQKNKQKHRPTSESIQLRSIHKTPADYTETIKSGDSQSELKPRPKREIGNRQSIQNGLVLPFTSDYPVNILTKDRILEDNASTMSPSNVDSMLATEDTNSVASNLELFQQFYSKYINTDDPIIREQLKQTYFRNLNQNDLKLPIQFGGQVPAMKNMVLSNKPSKERKLSVHQQFEHIDEDSEDEIHLTLNSNTLNVTRLDQIYSNNGSVASASFRSTTVPIESNNPRYIEKVGVWLHQQESDHSKETNGNYLSNRNTDFDPDNLINHRSLSGKSFATTSDHSQSSSFNRFLLPTQSKKQRKQQDEIIHIRPHTNSTYNGITHSDSHSIRDTTSFNSTSTAFRPLIIHNGKIDTSYA